MTRSICYSCGVAKTDVFAQCVVCKAVPRNENELARSLALSEHLHSAQQLTIFAEDIRAHRKLSFGPGVLDQAREALKDKQLFAMLGMATRTGQHRTAAPSSAQPPGPVSGTAKSPLLELPAMQALSPKERVHVLQQVLARRQQTRPVAAEGTGSPRKLKVRGDAPQLTALDRTAFGVLGATTCDDRRRIVALAEEKSLTTDSETCARARADLINPRVRLAAEVAWLAGVSPKRAHAYGVLLKHDLTFFLSEAAKEEPLLQANLIAAAIERLDPDTDSFEWTARICELASRVDEIDPQRVLRTINADRAVAGFPEVRGPEPVEAALAEQRRQIAGVVHDAMERLPTPRMLEVMTAVVETASDSGRRHAPMLVDELIDRFSVGAHAFLEKESANIQELLQTAEESAPSGKHLVDPLVDKLDQLVHNWLLVARPIQVSMKARGIEHEQSRALGYAIRNLGIRLYNAHDLLDQAQRLVALLRTAFSELPELADKIGEDAATLAGFADDRRMQALLGPLLKRCKDASDAAEADPSSADQTGQSVLSEAPKFLSALESGRAPGEMVAQAKDLIAVTLMNCAIAFGNKTAKWKPCISLLEASLRFAIDAGVRERVGKNLEIVRKNDRAFGDLTPIASAPSLTTFNGIGCTLYGSSDLDSETGSYLSTYYFVVFAIPIFPISRYRVIPTGGGYRFLGKAPLRPFDKWHIAISIGLLLWIFAQS